jgi:hypothetical protein
VARSYNVCPDETSNCRRTQKDLSPEKEMNIARLTYLRSWVRSHPDDGTAIFQFDYKELRELNEYRRTKMGLGVHTILEALDAMIADIQKKENVNA